MDIFERLLGDKSIFTAKSVESILKVEYSLRRLVIHQLLSRTHFSSSKLMFDDGSNWFMSEITLNPQRSQLSVRTERRISFPHQIIQFHFQTWSLIDINSFQSIFSLFFARFACSQIGILQRMCETFFFLFARNIHKFWRLRSCCHIVPNHFQTGVNLWTLTLMLPF